MNAFFIYAAAEMSAQAILTHFIVMVHKMVWTDELAVMCSLQYLAAMFSFTPPFVHFQYDGRRKLKIKIIHMYGVRLKVIKNQPDFFAGVAGIYCFKRVCQLAELAPAMKIHIVGIGIYAIADTAFLAFHAEKLHFMSHALELLAELEHISFRTAVRVKELIYHQNLHDCPTLSVLLFQ